jgi:hypothetical protein
MSRCLAEIAEICPGSSCLAAYLHGVPGADNVNPASVTAHFGSDISGADVHEIVCCTAYFSGSVSEPELITTAKSGRFWPQLPSETRRYLAEPILFSASRNEINFVRGLGEGQAAQILNHVSYQRMHGLN